VSGRRKSVWSILSAQPTLRWPPHNGCILVLWGAIPPPSCLPSPPAWSISHISKKTFFSRWTEPASRRIVSAHCFQSSWISRVLFAFHFLRLVHLDTPLSLYSVRRACCGPTASSCLALVSAPLSSCLLASCLLLAVASFRRPSLLPSHLWRPRSVRFHLLPSAAILHRSFLILHPTGTFIIPLLFTRCPVWLPCRRPTLVGFPSHMRA